MTNLYVETSGAGTPVVLVHGSLATGQGEWMEQQPIANEGYRLIVLDRRGYGSSPPADGEDFLRDADDITVLMGEGAHLVGHSYGGLGAMIAAARRPEATLSLALLEPPVFSLAPQNDAARSLDLTLRQMWGLDLPDELWVERFLQAVGTDIADLPPGVLDEIVPMVPMLREGRPVWDAELPLDELADATFPKLVVSGGHNEAFEAICDELATRINSVRK